MGFVGGGAGRRDSGVRRVDGYLGTYETVVRIEKCVRLPAISPTRANLSPLRFLQHYDFPVTQILRLRRMMLFCKISHAATSPPSLLKFQVCITRRLFCSVCLCPFCVCADSAC